MASCLAFHDSVRQEARIASTRMLPPMGGRWRWTVSRGHLGYGILQRLSESELVPQSRIGDRTPC